MTEQKRKKRRKKETAGTIFDDVFRTIAEKMSPFLIPLINEVFGTNYDKNTSIHHDSETHMTLLGRRSTDSCFTVKSEYQYHLECQSNPDSTIVVRFFEYDVAIAIMEAEKSEGIVHIRFPRSAVLYLRHTMNTPDKESMVLEFSDGSSHSYAVPIIKAQNYSLDEIFEKELFILLPFYLLRYEKGLKGIDNRESDRMHLLMDYQKIHQWLIKEIAKIDCIEYDDVKALIVRIADYLLQKEEKTRKGVGEAMGGKVLELFSEQVAKHKEDVKKYEEDIKKHEEDVKKHEEDVKKLEELQQRMIREQEELTREQEELTREQEEFTREKQSFEKEKQQYAREQLGQGEALLASLLKFLLDSGKNEDISKVLTDEAYREKLYVEFNLK